MYIYIPLCRYWIALYRYVLVFIVPHVDIELEDSKQFILNIPRMPKTVSNSQLSVSYFYNLLIESEKNMFVIVEFFN